MDLKADQEHVHAQFNLAFCYDHGIGVAKNENEALKWYQKAAEQGDTETQTIVSTRLLS